MQVRPMGPLKPTDVMKEKIYIKTKRIGFIPQLNMQGPIITPIPVSREVAKSMVVAGIETFEYWKDSEGKQNVRLLTIQNVYTGEGDYEKPFKPDEDNKGDGVQKPEVPTTSGVAQKTPVQPVNLKGVSTQSKTEEPTPEVTEETMSEENTTEETSEDNPAEEKTDTANSKSTKKRNRKK